MSAVGEPLGSEVLVGQLVAVREDAQDALVRLGDVGDGGSCFVRCSGIRVAGDDAEAGRCAGVRTAYRLDVEQ